MAPEKNQKYSLKWQITIDSAKHIQFKKPSNEKIPLKKGDLYAKILSPKWIEIIKVCRRFGNYPTIVKRGKHVLYHGSF